MGKKREYIKIEELEVKKNALISRLTCSRGIRKYLSSDTYYAKYDLEIDKVDRSILQIPAVSSIVMLAWVIDADVYIEELDRAYLESLDKIKPIMREWYPGLSFDIKIDVKNIIHNSLSNNGYGLLFSGGIDSTTSYIRYRDKKPNLILIRRSPRALRQEESWTYYKERMAEFSRCEGVEINFIDTNAYEFVEQGMLHFRFGKYLIFSWHVFHHGVSHLSLCAPLTAVKNLGTLVIASTVTEEWEYPWGSHPLIDNNTYWADVKVIHDGYELSRQEKVRHFVRDFIQGYIEREGNYPFLQVCEEAELACNKCEKCLQAIPALVLENIDVNKCRFNVDDRTFDYIKQAFLIKGIPLSLASFSQWEDIQNHIPETLEGNLYNSKEFFRWFRDFDLSKCKPTKASPPFLKGRLYSLYRSLPKGAQNAVRRIVKGK